MDQETKKEFDKLARMVQEGFANTATKDELKMVEADLRREMGEIRKEMVTKGELKSELNKTKLELQDFVEEKLSDLRGDIVVLIRKEDRKVNQLIEILRKREVISEKEVGSLVKMEPFAKEPV